MEQEFMRLEELFAEIKEFYHKGIFRKGEVESLQRSVYERYQNNLLCQILYDKEVFTMDIDYEKNFSILQSAIKKLPNHSFIYIPKEKIEQIQTDMESEKNLGQYTLKCKVFSSKDVVIPEFRELTVIEWVSFIRQYRFICEKAVGMNLEKKYWFQELFKLITSSTILEFKEQHGSYAWCTLRCKEV